MKAKIVNLAVTLAMGLAAQSAAAKNKRCGLGSRFFGGNKGISSQTSENGTNRLSSGDASITSGTSGCKHNGHLFFDPVGMNEEEQKFFVDANLEELMVDMSVGYGETIDSLFALLGCDPSDRPRFTQMIQVEYGYLTKDARADPEVLLTRLKDRLAGDPKLMACTGARSLG